MKFTTLFVLSALAAARLLTAGTIEDVDARKHLDARYAIDVLRVASAVSDGETITVGPLVFEVDTTTSAGVTAGHVRIDLHGGSTVAATGTLTSDNTNVADGETVTIGSKVYTFKTSLTPTEGQVLIGGSADASLLNLIGAINHTGSPGTGYSVAAANTSVSAAASVTSHAFAVTALIPGAGGNSIASTETSLHLSWGGSTLASGVSPTAAEMTTAFTTAANAAAIPSAPIAVTRISANEMLFVWMQPNNGSNSIAATTTMAGSNNVWAAATFYGGATEPKILRAPTIVGRGATATEAALLTCHFFLPIAPAAAIVQVRSSAGVMKAFDGTVTLTGNRVDVNSTGSTNVASGDIVTILATN